MAKRLFISIDIPSDIKDRLLFECENNFPANDWRLMKKDNLRITLAFLGPVRKEKIDDIIPPLEDIFFNIEKFDLKIEKIILGPPKKEKTMIWAKISENKKLPELSLKIKDALINQGIDSLKKDYKRFSPHITLAKKRTPKKNIQTKKDFFIETDEIFTVKSAELMESELKKEGSEYKTILSFEFNEN